MRAILYVSVGSDGQKSQDSVHKPPTFLKRKERAESGIEPEGPSAYQLSNALPLGCLRVLALFPFGGGLFQWILAASVCSPCFLLGGGLVQLDPRCLSEWSHLLRVLSDL